MSYKQVAEFVRFKFLLNRMEKYSDYLIVHANTADELSKEVKQYLKGGWLVLGAPFSHPGETGTQICQALIKQDATRSGSIGFNRKVD